MTNGEGGGLSAIGFPKRTGILHRAAGIDTETSDGHEDVAVASVDGDPTSRSWLAIVDELFGYHGPVEQTRFV